MHVYSFIILFYNALASTPAAAAIPSPTTSRRADRAVGFAPDRAAVMRTADGDGVVAAPVVVEVLVVTVLNELVVAYHHTMESITIDHT